MAEGEDLGRKGEGGSDSEPEALAFPSLFTEEEFDAQAESRTPPSGLRVLEPGEREREERLQVFRVKEAPWDEASAMATVEKFSPRLAEKLHSARAIGAELAELANLGIDERGSRSGFPPEVFDALMHLAVHAKPFEDSGKVGSHSDWAPATPAHCPWGSNKR